MAHMQVLGPINWDNPPTFSPMTPAPAMFEPIREMRYATSPLLGVSSPLLQAAHVCTCSLGHQLSTVMAHMKWGCNMCQSRFTYNPRLRCNECDFDLCNTCATIMQDATSPRLVSVAAPLSPPGGPHTQGPLQHATSLDLGVSSPLQYATSPTLVPATAGPPTVGLDVDCLPGQQPTIAHVHLGSPAHDAGLLQGDRIISVSATNMTTRTEVKGYSVCQLFVVLKQTFDAATRAGGKMIILVERGQGGSAHVFEGTLGPQGSPPHESGRSPPHQNAFPTSSKYAPFQYATSPHLDLSSSPGGPPTIGLDVDCLPGQVPVIAHVHQGSPAHNAGLVQGDRILSVSATNMTTRTEVKGFSIDQVIRVLLQTFHAATRAGGKMILQVEQWGGAVFFAELGPSIVASAPIPVISLPVSVNTQFAPMMASPMIASPISASSYLPESSIMASAPIPVISLPVSVKPQFAPMIASPMIASPIAASSYLPESGARAREMVGIGLRLGTAHNGQDVEVLDIVRGLAAAESNYFRVGDQIMLIDGISVRGMPLSQVRSLTLGEAGSRVILVMRSCDQEEYRVTLTRKPSLQYDAPVHEADFVDGQQTYVTLQNHGIVQTSQEIHSVHDTGLVANF